MPGTSKEKAYICFFLQKHLLWMNAVLANASESWSANSVWHFSPCCPAAKATGYCHCWTALKS